MKQPDTSKMSGRHEVELASRTKRLQICKDSCSWQWCSDPAPNIRFDWCHNDYRIHPDDLGDTIDPGEIEQQKWYCQECGWANTQELTEPCACLCGGCGRLSAFKTTSPKPPTYRPWTKRDVKAGTVLRLKSDNDCTVQITRVTPKGVIIPYKSTNALLTFDELLTSNYEQLDGTPCGRLE